MNPQVQPPVNLSTNHRSALLAAVFGVLFVAAAAFGLWAFSGRQDYKNNTDKKIASAVAGAKAQQSAADQAQFDTQNKSPYKTYTSNPSNGNISFSYPKTWSAYVDESGATQPIDGYFFPNQVPGIQSATAFALRVELLSQDYASVISQLEQGVQNNTATASAFLPAKLKANASAQVGTRLDGVVGQDSQGNNLNGAMVVLPVRDKTLEIYTEAGSYLNDFNNTVLPSLTYNP